MEKIFIKTLSLIFILLVSLNFSAIAVEKNMVNQTAGGNEISNHNNFDKKDDKNIQTRKLTLKEKIKIIKEYRKELKIVKKGKKSDVPIVLIYILAVILPPLAVGLFTNWGKPTLWNLLFTICFWIPGIVHAFYIILR